MNTEIFKCKKCRVEYSTHRSAKFHEKYCRLNHEDVLNIIDDYCNFNFSTAQIKHKYKVSFSIISKILKGKMRSYSESVKTVRKNYPEKFLHSEETKLKISNSLKALKVRKKPNYIGNFQCKKCLRKFVNKQSYCGHSSHCLKNRNYKNIFIPWNKGLTKETSSIVKRIAEKNSVCQRGKTCKKMTDEQRKKMSISAKLKYKNGYKNKNGSNAKWHSYKRSDGIDINVQGYLEFDTCFILDDWKKNNKIFDWEYTNDRVQYLGLDMEYHTYILDFKVFKNDREFYYIETKGYKTKLDDLKWKAVTDQGFDFQVWRRNDVLAHKRKIARMVSVNTANVRTS